MVRLKRRFRTVAMVTVIALLAGILSACGSKSSPTDNSTSGGDSNTTAPASFDWKRYSGTSIRVIALSTGLPGFIQKQLPEFEQLTGIKVNIELLPTAQMRTKISVELSGGSTELDVFQTATAQEGIRFLDSGWYHPLDDFLKNSGLTNKEYDFADFPVGPVESAKANGKLVGIPSSTDGQILAYRKDLFQKAGISKPPATWDEFEDAAKRLNNIEPGVAGAVYRGNGNLAAGLYSMWLQSYGGDWLDKNGEPALNTPEAIAAFKKYVDVLKNYGPTGAIALTNTDVTDRFSQGKAAMVIEAQIAVPTGAENKEKSKVAGNVGYAAIPAGPKGAKPQSWSWLFSVSGLSKKKEAAWYFIQWATSKEMSKKMMQANIAVPRASAWQDAEARKSFLPELADSILGNMKNGTAAWLPPIIAATEARDVVGRVIEAGLQGQDIKAAADKANIEMKALMKK